MLISNPLQSLVYNEKKVRTCYTLSTIKPTVEFSLNILGNRELSCSERMQKRLLDSDGA
jgi:hypothetical protein